MTLLSWALRYTARLALDLSATALDRAASALHRAAGEPSAVEEMRRERDELQWEIDRCALPEIQAQRARGDRMRDEARRAHRELRVTRRDLALARTDFDGLAEHYSQERATLIRERDSARADLSLLKMIGCTPEEYGRAVKERDEARAECERLRSCIIFLEQHGPEHTVQPDQGGAG